MCPRLLLLLYVVHDVETSIATISLFTFIAFISTRLVLASLCFFSHGSFCNCGSMLLLHLFRCSCVVVVRRYVSLLVVASQCMCTFIFFCCLNVARWALNLLQMFYIRICLTFVLFCSRYFRQTSTFPIQDVQVSLTFDQIFTKSDHQYLK